MIFMGAATSNTLAGGVTIEVRVVGPGNCFNEISAA
jgi:hypothetical protein